jgi:hypothetical protein
MKKKLDKIQFVIEILTHVDNQRSCYFCKYNTKNYNEPTTEFMSFCSDKCKYCDNFIAWTNLKNKRPNCLRSEYKPLYVWEEEKNE